MRDIEACQLIDKLYQNLLKVIFKDTKDLAKHVK